MQFYLLNEGIAGLQFKLSVVAVAVCRHYAPMAHYLARLGVMACVVQVRTAAAAAAPVPAVAAVAGPIMLLLSFVLLCTCFAYGRESAKYSSAIMHKNA
jgi:hypothetical protein